MAIDSVPEGARPGQLARVSLTTQKTERLLIPFVALRRSSDGDYVYVLVKNDKQMTVQQQKVTTGLRINDDIEVIAGLSDKQQVVIRGFTRLREGKPVMVVDSADTRAVAIQ